MCMVTPSYSVTVHYVGSLRSASPSFMTSSFAIRLGKNIRAARTALGMTQGDLADQIGVSRQSVSFYESGKQWPQPLQADAIKRALGIDVPHSPDAVAVVRTHTLSPEAAKGVRFAALRMSETLTALLREANEADEHAEAAALAAAAIATMQTHAAQSRATLHTSPPRPRRGIATGRTRRHPAQNDDAPPAAHQA